MNARVNAIDSGGARVAIKLIDQSKAVLAVRITIATTATTVRKWQVSNHQAVGIVVAWRLRRFKL